MAKQPEAETEAAAESPAAAPKSKKKLIIIVAVAVLALGGGAAGWMMLGGKHKEGEAQAKTPEKKVVKAEGPPVFLPLESFVVNLQPPTSSQFLQVDITLRLADAHTVDEVKSLMPEVRDRVLRLLATRTAPELVATGGREKLAEAVRIEVTRIVEPDAVKEEEIPKVTKESAEPDAPAEPSADTEPAAEESAEAPAEEERKVRAVLFTSFIIQ